MSLSILHSPLRYTNYLYQYIQAAPNLVLAPPPDVPADVELLLTQFILAQQVIELIHGQANQGLLRTQNK